MKAYPSFFRSNFYTPYPTLTALRVVDEKIKRLMAIAEGSQDDAEITTAKEIVGAMNVLMSMLKNITIRPTAFASAVIAFMATHKLVIVLEKTDMAEIEGGFKALRDTWVLDLATLTKRNAKWTKLSASVPSSFLSFLRTQLELAVVSLQDPAELGEAAKVGTRIVTGFLKSVMTLSVDEDLLNAGFSAAEVSSAMGGAEAWERARAGDYVRAGGPSFSRFPVSLQLTHNLPTPPL